MHDRRRAKLLRSSWSWKRTDFVHKTGNVLKELNESEVWIDMILRRKMAEGQHVLRLQEDCNSLCRIIAASVRTPKRDLGRPVADVRQKEGDTAFDRE